MAKLTGILSIEHTPTPHGARFRVLFLATPINPEAIKTAADHHTLEAKWVTFNELSDYELRSQEVISHFRKVETGATVHSLSILQSRQDV